MIDLDDKALAPCPFCGGEAERFTILDSDEVANVGGDVITCQQCGASSQVQFGEKATLNAAWNCRASALVPADVAALVKRLEQQSGLGPISVSRAAMKDAASLITSLAADNAAKAARIAELEAGARDILCVRVTAPDALDQCRAIAARNLPVEG